MANESELSPTILTNGALLISSQSLVKAAFKDGDTLRKAPYRVFRAIVPTESVLQDEKQKALLPLTTSTFAQFMKGFRSLSWFEGRE